jgi:hypothetical protein
MIDDDDGEGEGKFEGQQPSEPFRRNPARRGQEVTELNFSPYVHKLP